MILIIAYGNSLRSDDGAGLFLGEVLETVLRNRGRDVERIALHQLTPEMSIDIADERVTSVVFVDTRVAEPGQDSFQLQVRRISHDGPGPSIGHHLDPSAVMAYARLLYGKDPMAWVLTVPGVDFEHGEKFSEITQGALDALPEFLDSLPPAWPEIDE